MSADVASPPSRTELPAAVEHGFVFPHFPYRKSLSYVVSWSSWSNHDRSGHA